MNPLKTLSIIRRKLLPASAPDASGASGEPAFDGVKAGLMLLTIAALSLMMSVHLWPARVPLHLNEISPREVRASRSVSYEDRQKTNEQRAEVSATARPVYDIDEHAASNVHRAVQELFNSIETVRSYSNARSTSASTGRKALKQGEQTDLTTKAIPSLQAATKLSSSDIQHLLTIPPTAYRTLTSKSLHLVDEIMDREIRDNGQDLANAHEEVKRRSRDMLAPDDASIVAALVNQALMPNRLYNNNKTIVARNNAARDVHVMGKLVPGEKVIAAGEVVRQDTLDKLTALGLLDPRIELTSGIAIFILAAMMVSLVVYYIAHRLPALYRDTRRLALLSTIVLLSVIGLKAGAALLGVEFSGGQLGFLGMMSVTAAGMLVCVLLDAHLAVLIVALLSIQSGIIMNHEIRFSVMTLLSGLVGIGSVTKVRVRNNLLTTTIALALSNVGLLWLMGMLFNDQPRELLNGSGWAVAVAPFATFLFWFGVMALERPFGILTHSTLLEMSAFDRPLLRQLCAVAPGTYAHSMMVGALAEAGAQAVEADGLLCRVGGYYHDIGKMNRPDFFIENQRNDNIHGRLSPSLSALIITAHVRDGIEMAKQHRLPAEIRDIIAQHHGTTLISYFYRQALADNVGGDCTPPGLEERFRYPGPKPQTREAAIVMLADSVEAAARCIDKPNREKLENLIGNIVRGKIEDGQLDQCPLTFADVKKITDAFLHVLRAMMHGRIDYPKEMPRSATAQSIPTPNETLRVVPMTGSTETTISLPSLPRESLPPSETLNETINETINETMNETMNTATISNEANILPRIVPLSALESETTEDITASELMYGHPFTERTASQSAHDPVKTGGAPFTGVGRPRPRGGKRPSDR